MKKTITLFSLLVLLASTATAFADNMTYRLRQQANSEYRIAVKRYNDAVHSHGDNLTGLPPKTKAANCKQLGSALYDNRNRVRMEDVFAKPRFEKQVRELEKIWSAYGCTK